ncbi:MAG: AAC(3) family N-acetyltransferase [Lentisphaeria bacterium]|nr:AAC(3) family N-acetyltransferase [Lentisphaeria bacterium]
MKNLRIEALKKEFSLLNLQDYTLTLASFERTASYRQFDASTRYVMEMLKQAGFSKIERLVHKADGKTSALDCIMPEAWDQYGRSFLEITSPDVPDYDRILADSDRHPQEAVIWSAPTPEGGSDGELVNFTALDKEHPDVKGKWVFLGENGVDIKGMRYRELASAGAAGLVITNFYGLETSPDDVVWFNGQGLTGWYHEKEAPRLPVYSISPRRAKKLLEMLKKGKVSVHAEMNTRIYDGEIYTVTAVIPGESEEEYALFAHLYEPFIADDALGFGVSCELGRLLAQRKTKLKKTLRVVFSMELYGFSAFLADPARRNRILAAMNLDSVNHGRRIIDFRLSPISLPYFTDWFFRDWFRKYLPDFTWKETRGNLSDDTFGGDPDIGVPTNWVYGPSADGYHHSTGRYFEPDWLLVKEEFPVLAGAIETLLSGDFTPDYGKLALREFKAEAGSILKNPELTNFEKSVRLKAELDRASAKLQSWEKYSGSPVDLAPVQALYKQLDQKIGPVQYERFSTPENRARNLVPRHLVPGQPFCLSRVPYPERTKFVMPRLLWALFDGKRDLLTCIRIMDGEIRTKTSPGQIRDIISGLRFLEKYGYVQVQPAVSVSSKEAEEALRKLGLHAGMELIVHSAFSAIGQMEGGAESFCRLLMKTIGPEGTLLMPAFTFNLYEGKDFGQPFDVRNSPSSCGILTEVFRKMPGICRSCDPCHSYSAWGRRAAELVQNHHKVPTVSRFSPLGLLEAADGWCLTISAANAVTFMHVVESSFGAPCLGRRTEEFPGILSDGRKVKLRTWSWRAKTCPECPANQTEKLFAMLRKAGKLKEAMLGNAKLCLFRLSDYRKVYEKLLKQVNCKARKARPRTNSATVKSDWDDRHECLRESDAFTGDLPEFS